MLAIVRDVTALKTREIELREALEHQAAIDEVLRALTRSAFDLNAVLRLIAGKAAELCKPGTAALYRRQDDGYRFVAGYGLEAAEEQRERGRTIVPATNTAVGCAALEARPFQSMRDSVGGTISTLAVPLLQDGTVIAVISIARASAEPFTDRQIDLLSTFADQAAVAIESARLREEREAGYEALLREGPLLTVDPFWTICRTGCRCMPPTARCTMNPASRELNQFPPEAFEHIHDMRGAMRWQLEHGPETLTEAEIEADLDRRMALFFSAGSYRREVHRGGRYLDVRWIPLPDGMSLVLHRDITELREREIEIAAFLNATEHAHRLDAGCARRHARPACRCSVTPAKCCSPTGHSRAFPGCRMTNFAALPDNLRGRGTYRWHFEHGGMERGPVARRSKRPSKHAPQTFHVPDRPAMDPSRTRQATQMDAGSNRALEAAAGRPQWLMMHRDM